MRSRIGGALVALAVVAAACTPSADEPSTTSIGTTTTAAGTTTSTEPLDQSLGPVAPPVRHPATADAVYFVLPDRFENGDPSNDTGGVDGGPLDHGFLATDRGFHHGGDLAGLTARLPYIAGLGVGAIWITPPFTNRFVQGGGSIENSSSSYHGYWIVDFENIDPHLGTNEEMEAFIAAAHDLGIAVYFDIVVNHTGDVITYAEDSYVYLPKTGTPYLTAGGEEFDPAEFAGTDEFPELDPAISFPYTPVFASEELATIKSPDWLNDVTLYHNRGNSTFQGESSLDGDFFGLDDLMTEHPRVVSGMTELFIDVMRRWDIDGYRVDTMKHVNIEFWEAFAPALRAAADEDGREFFFFGEVLAEDPILNSSYTNVGVPATADFISGGAIERYVADGSGGEFLAQAFDDDDWFTDVDNNASMQVRIIGGHDAGRLGYAIVQANPSADDDALLARVRLAHDLNFLTRGVPLVYYGDEQGFVGDGGDQLARQDMFPSVVPEYIDDDLIGTDLTVADDNFDTGHPLYVWIADLTAFRGEHTAFVTGAQIVHDVTGPLFAFSRIDRDERIEYVVVTNNSTLTVPARLSPMTEGTDWEILRGATDASVEVDSPEIVVSVPPLSSVVLRAGSPLPIPDAAAEITLTRPSGPEIPTFRYRLEAELSDDRYAEVSFAVSIDGGEPILLGTDDAAPYRLYWDTSAIADGASVEVIATVADGSGRLRSTTATTSMGSRG